MLVVVAVTLSVAGHVAAQNAPDKISFQGFVTKPGGVPLDSAATMKFFLFRNGSSIWSETQNDVAIEDGVFGVVLGEVTPLDDIAFYGSMTLKAVIGTSDTLGSGTALTSAPFALALRNLRVDPETNSSGPNMIGGWSGNAVGANVEGATIGGGGDPNAILNSYPNQVLADYGTVSGGSNNTASGVKATVSGGFTNTAEGASSVVSGGASNSATANYSAVGGGGENLAAGTYSVVGGGALNSAKGDYSIVPGGSYSIARGAYSFAAGKYARANHDGSFAWSDASAASVYDTMASSAENQFLIRAAGGVGIGTGKPKRGLTISRDAEEAAYQLELRNVGDIHGGNFTGIAFTQTDSGERKTHPSK